MWNEFKAFVARGNVVDMAVGVILGTAFGKIVTSLVSDILMPPIGLLLNEVDFSNLFIDLSRTHYASLAQAKAAGAATINYGVFVSDVINFLILAGVMFWLMKPINRWKGIRAVATAPAVKDCPYCFSQIPLKAVRCAQCTATFTP